MANLRAFRVGASRSHEHADIDPENDGTPDFELYFDAPEDLAEPYSGNRQAADTKTAQANDKTKKKKKNVRMSTVGRRSYAAPAVNA